LLARCFNGNAGVTQHLDDSAIGGYNSLYCSVEPLLWP
jgi:hypothetical protein